MIAGKPCVLIADDDPVSLHFLESAAERCGCEVMVIANAAGALRALGTVDLDLLLLDRRMPGLDGIALLRALRAAGIRAPAIATSAELDPATVSALRAAGFTDVLLKPASLPEIRALLARYIPVGAYASTALSGAETGDAQAALLDDAAALAATGGDRDALRALRGLFATELSAIQDDLASGLKGAEVDALCERLHRLRASCGICGALQLGAAAARLEHDLRAGANRDESVSTLLRACQGTAAVLTASEVRDRESALDPTTRPRHEPA